MRKHLLLALLFCFNSYHFLKLQRRWSYSFLNNSNNVFRKKEKYRSNKLKCRVEGIEYKVQNVENSLEFYKNVLGFKVFERGENFVKMILGPNEAHIKLIQKEDKLDMTIGEHSFLGLGINLKEFEINKTKMYRGNVEEGIDERPITACILPDEDAQIRRFWKNCFITDPDGYGIEVVLTSEGSKLDRIRLFTTSTKDSQRFYSDILGMEVKKKKWHYFKQTLIKIQSHLEEISYPWNVYGGMSYFFSSKTNGTTLQLAYAYDEDKLHMGNSLGNLILGFNDLSQIKKRLLENNINVEKSNSGLIVKDLDGYSVYLKSEN
ncbi:glyoxalase I [Plasmodium gonderi]|uniref:Glyoxalase I n=1 Tax=Plasmodium gonderi TaxID=77519 RepID=A0A1Y1JNK0_PLAGO|nr:glyoxalase I [Plasmodium gonderi]GAW81973.1 glyoxalase I [Plasmodium gonderi]